MVVGDTSGISDQLDADAKTTGITHLLAVSGSHFAILCGMVVVVLRRFGPRTAAIGGTLTLLGLVILVGPQPSVLRAALMGGIGMLALLTGRTRSVVPALATAVIALVLIDPGLAVSVGFALSVLATGGLILIAPAWSESLQRRGFPGGWADVLAVPAAAQIVTMPVIVLISGSVSVVGVFANLLVAPVVAPALILGVCCAITGPWWSGAAAVLAHLSAPLLDWIAGVAHRLARWPHATVPWPATPTGAVVLAGLSITMVILLRHRRFRELFAAAAAGVALIAVPTRIIAPGWPAQGWLLTACEVGQGDAMVLSTGEQGTAVVIDTGPDPGLVDACLDRLGIGTIPLLVLTHLHADHVDGLVGAMHGRTIGAIAVGPGREPSTAWRDIQRQAADRGISGCRAEARHSVGQRGADAERAGAGEGICGNGFRPEQRLGGGDGPAERGENADDRRHRSRGAAGPAERRYRSRCRCAEGAAPRFVEAARPIRPCGLPYGGGDRRRHRQRLRAPQSARPRPAGPRRGAERAAYRRGGGRVGRAGRRRADRGHPWGDDRVGVKTGIWRRNPGEPMLADQRRLGDGRPFENHGN